MMSTHEAHLLMISKNKAYFGMMGGFDGEASELPYLARETFINGTIPLKGNCDSTHRGSPMLYRHQQICPILGDVSKILKFSNLQKTPESSQNELWGTRGCKMGLLGPQIPNKVFSSRFRPDRPYVEL